MAGLELEEVFDGGESQLFQDEEEAGIDSGDDDDDTNPDETPPQSQRTSPPPASPSSAATRDERSHATPCGKPDDPPIELGEDGEPLLREAAVVGAERAEPEVGACRALMRAAGGPW